MRDCNGKELKEGDYVQYLKGGDIKSPSSSTLKVVKIVWSTTDNSISSGWMISPCNIPFAVVLRVDDSKLQDTPFYSRELRKLRIEELI